MLILLDVMLRRIVRRGDLTFTDAAGSPHRYGDGTGPAIAARVTQRRVEWHLVLDPQLALGESYMQGTLSMERGRIYDLLELLLSNAQKNPVPVWARALDVVRYLIRRAAQFNPAGRAQRNVAHHYDIDGNIYDLFLDSDRQYSCAYFTSGAALAAAQVAKNRTMAASRPSRPS